jgi:hypothetical protein
MICGRVVLNHNIDIGTVKCAPGQFGKISRYFAMRWVDIRRYWNSQFSCYRFQFRSGLGMLRYHSIGKLKYARVLRTPHSDFAQRYFVIAAIGSLTDKDAVGWCRFVDWCGPTERG